MAHPLVYELNTRCWLQALSQRQGRAVTLANLPETEMRRWAQLGFTHIWLMGIWETGPRSRAEALRNPYVRERCDLALPGWHKTDVGASPFAISSYEVAPEFGGAEALKIFREQLRGHGMRLLLDFVPNHLGLDHPWLQTRPELFVHTDRARPETFPVETPAGRRWIAHGKDPFFPAWTDTAQLDYRRPETQAAVLTELQSVAARCDGVRCDMAMLLLPEVFARNWEAFEPPAAVAGDFWPRAMATVREAHPEFLFVAEVYWQMEERLQAAGFDFTYDKELYDRVIARAPWQAQRQLLLASKSFLARSAHFLENHDEPRIASLLSVAEHRAAALLLLALPGLRLLHEGQLAGRKILVPVQLRRCAPEPPQAEIVALYEQLLAVLRESAVGRGEWELLPPRPAWPENSTFQSVVLLQWQAAPEQFELAVINLDAQAAQCYAPLTVESLAGREWALRDLLGVERHVRAGDLLAGEGLFLDVPAHAAQWFQFRPAL
jgi:hypothetical protein